MINERLELEKGIETLGLSASSTQIDALLLFLENLELTNKSFNLTRIARSDYVSLHLLDSLATLTVLDKAANLRLLDIGTGAGFPGVPLAALLPASSITLLDATAKKVRFASETAHACGITNVSGIHGRAEMLARTPQHRERYDLVTSRALAPFPLLIELMLPLVKIGGQAIALKGSSFEAEISGTEDLIRELGGDAPQVHAVKLPGTEIVRHLIVIPKKRATHKKFPRVE